MNRNTSRSVRVGAALIAFAFAFAAAAASATERGSARSLSPLLELELLDPGTVNAITTDLAGGTILVGEFASMDGMPRNRLARLQPNGALDPAWRPEPCGNQVPVAVAAGSNGDVFVATSTCVTRLRRDAKGQAEIAWSTGLQDVELTTLAVSTDGNVYAGGGFAGGGSLIRIGESNGALDETWRPAVHGSIYAIEFLPDGDFVVAGAFDGIDDVWTARNVARFSGETGLVDPDWLVAGIDSTVMAAETDSTGEYVFLGTTTGLNRVALTDGQVSAGWLEPLLARVDSLQSNGLGALYLGGSGSSMGSHSVVRIDEESGEADATWLADVAGSAHSLALSEDGVVTVAGHTGRFDHDLRLGYFRLDAMGGLMASLDAERPYTRDTAFATVGNGRTVIAGGFHKIGGVRRHGLAAIDVHGAVDRDWRPAVDSGVRRVASVNADDIVISGSFRTINGVARQGLAKLSATTGAVDLQWAPVVWPDAGGIDQIVGHDSKGIFIAGSFANVNGVDKAYLARLDAATGHIDAGWSGNVDGVVRHMALGDHLFIQGDFTHVGGVPSFGLAKLDPTKGWVDDAWRPLVEGSPRIAVHGAYVYLFGSVSSITSEPVFGIGRVAVHGEGFIDVWRPVVMAGGAPGFVGAIAGDSTDSVIIAGSFDMIDGTPVTPLRRLSADWNAGLDTSWRPAFDQHPVVHAVHVMPNGHVLAHVDAIDQGRLRRTLSIFPPDAEIIFADGFESGD